MKMKKRVDNLNFKDLKDSDFEDSKDYYMKIFNRKMETDWGRKYKIQLELNVVAGKGVYKSTATERDKLIGFFKWFASDILAELCDCYLRDWEIKNLEVNPLENEIITKNQLKFNKIGIIGWMSNKVFYCPKCDKRYDFAIYYDDEEYQNKPSCKICNSDMELTEPRLRLGCPHPKKGGW